MFLDRLWIRIRGGLLSLKEDLAGDADLRSQAEDFLEKLENRLNLSPYERGRSRDPADRIDAIVKKMEDEQESATATGAQDRQTDHNEDPSTREMERMWDDLLKKREKSKGQTDHEDDHHPNPRRLG